MGIRTVSYFLPGFHMVSRVEPNIQRGFGWIRDRTSAPASPRRLLERASGLCVARSPGCVSANVRAARRVLHALTLRPRGCPQACGGSRFHRYQQRSEAGLTSSAKRANTLASYVVSVCVQVLNDVLRSLIDADVESDKYENLPIITHYTKAAVRLPCNIRREVEYSLVTLGGKWIIPL